MSTLEFDDQSSNGGNAERAQLETVAKPQPKAKPAPTNGAEEKAAEAPAAPPKPAVPKGVYTVLAREGVNAAELINARLAKKTVGKSSPRRIEVASPDGPSTSGGKKARQNIKLVPTGSEGGALMCGWLDVATKEAELRSYEDVAKLHKQRFGTKFDVTEPEYAAVVKDLESMLGVLQFTMIKEEGDEDEDDGAAERSGPPIVLIALGIAAVVALLALAMAL